MEEKPPIINIGKWNNEPLEWELTQAVKAQRDADVEWYDKLEMQYLDDCREVNEMQIRQQAAQAIFNDLWSDCPHGRFKRLYCLCCIKELEAKYLEGK